ncbi:MAG: hypothetical protein DMF49_03995 [Acidobacteria bacterium]|nr:MAG: hypothetical protein DMF49_03995 [Acidobacteriota bacterium]
MECRCRISSSRVEGPPKEADRVHLDPRDEDQEEEDDKRPASAEGRDLVRDPLHQRAGAVWIISP